MTLAIGSAKALPAGEYRLKEGEGTLVINADHTFRIDILGTNTHTCNFEGKISKEVSRIEDSACYLRFKLKDADVSVTSENRYSEDSELGCSSFCGLHAAFSGGVFLSLPKCTQSSVIKARKVFKAQYDRKAYNQARQTLTTLLSSCAHVLHWTELGWIRNDLALAQYRTGNKKTCLATLKPLLVHATTPDEEFSIALLPMDADLMISLAKVTRTNLKLCSASPP
ncbi:hypothetical protein [Rhodoferax mekongensis]|uniref:hypothetical protein n=1 Tax=Rhodoferax mekongensis TaxID=3068341 RepID=UPI0028BE2ADD|nr:hypothetical protein [Rhodoferax sp. TBRC 17199]MDT7516216.1 hypothetical protein [Rhodoferax sp. TBRC 17199]